MRDELVNIRDHAVFEMYQVHCFLKSAYDAIRTISRSDCPMSSISKKERESIFTSLDDGQKKQSVRGRTMISVTLDSEEQAAVLLGTISKQQVPNMLADMTIIYVMATLEAYLKDMLAQILFSQKAMLKTKTKNLTYDRLCEFESIDELISALVEREVYGLGSNIDGYNKYFAKDPFLIQLDNFKEWETIREANYRRHTLVHSQSLADASYCKAVGFAKKHENLVSDINYVRNLNKAIVEFILFFDSEAAGRLKLTDKSPMVEAYVLMLKEIQSAAS